MNINSHSIKTNLPTHYLKAYRTFILVSLLKQLIACSGLVEFHHLAFTASEGTKSLE